MDISVRYARRNELEEVNRLRKQVNEVHVNGRPDIFKAGFCQQLRDHVYDNFDSGDSDIIVALAGGTVCGFAAVRYVKRSETPFSYERSYYMIEEFGVDENYRRKGVAAGLIGFCKEEARAKGYKRMELDYWAFNEAAEKFYEQAGFKVYRKYTELFL